MDYRVWFLYGGETRKDEWHFIIVSEESEELAAIRAMNIILGLGDEGAVVQKVENE